ncbi:hypothetical protein SLA2020_147670 [Shorea laevis]
MAGRKRRKQKFLASAEIVDDSDERMSTEERKENLESKAWCDLPVELIEQILSKLKLEDNIRSSAVCKSWHRAAVSVRVVSQSPWLMYFPRYGDMYDFYDPTQCKTCSLYLPELCGSRVCYSKDGWLLLCQLNTNCLFFFNPFTREKIKLPVPRFELKYQIVAFSCAPTSTSTSCVVFTLKHSNPSIVVISTCQLGAEEWVTVNHQNRLPFVSSIWNKIVFCNGCFYCLSLFGWIGVYNPLECFWNVLSVPPPRCPDSFLNKNWWKGLFMAEHNGEILVIYTCCSENPIVFKLVQSETAWEEMKTLHGMTLFASFLSSHSKVDLPGIMRNNVYFSKVRFFGKRCISYSVNDNRYYPRKQGHDWGELDPFELIWIEPPHNALSLI